MHFLASIATALAVTTTVASASTTAGIEALVQRRMPGHVDDFSFSLTSASNTSAAQDDCYTVANGPNNTIAISGSSPSALAYGLRYYLATYAHVDLWWFIGSRLHLAPSPLPKLNGTYEGGSIVPWRYHFNTVTFSYTSAFWNWEDWELQLAVSYTHLTLPTKRIV